MESINTIIGIFVIVIGLCVMAWFDRPKYFSRVREYLSKRIEYNYVHWKNIPGVALVHKFPRFFIVMLYVDVNLVAAILMFWGITLIA